LENNSKFKTSQTVDVIADKPMCACKTTTAKKDETSTKLKVVK